MVDEQTQLLEQEKHSVLEGEGAFGTDDWRGGDADWCADYQEAHAQPAGWHDDGIDDWK